MEFAVGDKVVHPHHGPGKVVGLERKELMDEVKYYYVIEIPSRGLTVHVPRRNIDQVGVRPAISRARLQRVLDILCSRPCQLPEDHNQRQEEVWDKLKTGHTISIAEVIRDLIWHQRNSHLTKRDSDLLRWGQDFLAEEIALVTGTDVSAGRETIENAFL